MRTYNYNTCVFVVFVVNSRTIPQNVCLFLLHILRRRYSNLSGAGLIFFFQRHTTPLHFFSFLSLVKSSGGTFSARYGENLCLFFSFLSCVNSIALLQQTCAMLCADLWTPYWSLFRTSSPDSIMFRAGLISFLPTSFSLRVDDRKEKKRLRIQERLAVTHLRMPFTVLSAPWSRLRAARHQ